jgi:ribosomal protein S12 methylthiotransferase accessory factor
MQDKTIPQLSSRLLKSASNNRHGITLKPQQARLSMSDDSALFHLGVPNSLSAPWESASGGVAEDYDSAVLAAVGEGIERYCAATAQLPSFKRSQLPSEKLIDASRFSLFTEEQRTQQGFPFKNIYSDEVGYTNVFDLDSGEELWVPQPLVVLRDDYKTGLPTSSGLAAGITAKSALLRSLQELIERDALMVTWLHGIPARSVKPPRQYEDRIRKLHGEMWVFDLTPAYSPFPFVAVAGMIPKRGRPRFSLGVACKNTWDEALHKAFLEWNQGVLFAGIYQRYSDVSHLNEPEDVRTFEEHAIYYMRHPEQWEKLPMFRDRSSFHRPLLKGTQLSDASALRLANEAFAHHRIAVYYRELTTPDVLQLGVRVVRALSPDLAQIFAHQDWPLLGGVEKMLPSRFPQAVKGVAFPNRMPHPLG